MSFLYKKVAAQDAAEYRVVHAKGVGKWWVEPNVSMFGGEWGKGRKEFSTREEAEKYAKGTGKTYIVRDECEGEDAAEFKVGDKVLRKGYPAPSPRDYYKVIEVHPNGGVKIDDGFNGYYSPNLIIRAKDSAAMDAITESDLKKHAHDFARHELGKYADELRKKRNALADIWEKTSIAQGAIRSGEYKQVDVDEYINPYVNVIDDAIRILERV